MTPGAAVPAEGRAGVARGLLLAAAMGPLRRLLLGIGLAVLPGCVTPSIPLPPPVLEALQFHAPTPGQIELEGAPTGAHANKRFAAYNESRGVGVLQQTAADGSFATIPFDGNANDSVLIWYETSSGDRSDTFRCTVTLDTALNTTVCH
jgi:hypothetical protein